MKTRQPILHPEDDDFCAPPHGYDRETWRQILVAFSNFFSAESSAQIEELRGFPFSDEDFISFYSGLEVESDRALGVLAFGFIEDQLEAALRYNFSSLPRDLHDDLLGSMFKPLGSASARLKVCRAFNWVTDSTYKKVNTLRDIRNGFAHRSCSHTFETASVRDRLNNFDLLGDEHIAHLLNDAELSTRQKFLVISAASSIYLPLELLASAASNRPSALEPFLWKVTLPLMGDPFDSMMNALLYVVESIATGTRISSESYEERKPYIVRDRVDRRASNDGTLSLAAILAWKENPTAHTITQDIAASVLADAAASNKNQ